MTRSIPQGNANIGQIYLITPEVSKPHPLALTSTILQSDTISLILDLMQISDKTMRWNGFWFIVNSDSGIVNTDSGKTGKVFTMNQNRRSR